jgi:large subunit ribosomal protein L10
MFKLQLSSVVRRSIPSLVNPFKFGTQYVNYSTESPIYNIETRSTGKPLLSRKTFLMDYYKYLNDNNDIVLYVHHNNIAKNDNKKLRAELKAAGAQFNVITNSIYNVYLRSENEVDPATAESTTKNKDVVHPLSALLSGPTALITIPKSEPSVVTQVLKTIKGLQEKLFVVGARIETSIYDIEDVQKFKDLPNKDQLQGQLAGLLTILGGAGLVRTLEASSNVLYLTMEQRRKDLDPEETKETTQEE